MKKFHVENFSNIYKLTDFVNKTKIKQKDIQSIFFIYGGGLVLFYWSNRQ